ncbi:hypothetical protein EI555_013535 [Monodon monoceros]|uniref:Ataxin-10 domain-containing protein n=1 Tax=Monodon monoceros TaxID=40151 RepID=A0A4U1EJM0_MONMO|nr:hypothetical protein EI555_013535 [Monodon monoceros]
MYLFCLYKSSAFRCGLQFLGNIASRNEDSQSIVWMHAFPELFLSCLNHPDKKIVAYSSMILFTSLNSERMKELEENLNIAIDVIEAHQKQPESEWPFLIITDHFLKSPELVKVMYAKMSNQERVTLLDLMIAKIMGDEPLSKDEIPVFLSHAELIASTFVDQCKTVLKLTSEQHAEDEEALATIRLLDVLCEMTANTDLLGYLQVFPGLLERVIELLRVIHAAGSDTMNIFSTCARMKAEGDVSHMAEGFKSHLIRLIGNLCYKSKDNQDKVRTWRRTEHRIIRSFIACVYRFDGSSSSSRYFSVIGIHKLTPGKTMTYTEFDFSVTQFYFTELEKFWSAHMCCAVYVLCVNELDGIALILDSCSIDDKNPCILDVTHKR